VFVIVLLLLGVSKSSGGVLSCFFWGLLLIIPSLAWLREIDRLLCS
jgi:hypothetical protein